MHQANSCPSGQQAQRIHKDTWQNFVTTYGENEARRRLRRHYRPYAFACDTVKDPHRLIEMLVTTSVSPRETIQQRRKRYAVLIRTILAAARAQRQRLVSYFASGVPATRIP